MKDHYNLTLQIEILADPDYSPDWINSEAQLALNKALQTLKNPVFDYLHYSIKVLSKEKVENTNTATNENK